MRVLPVARMGLGALRHRITGRRTPLNVMIAVTNRCTAQCAYCSIPTRTGPELSTAEILHLLEELRAAGTVRVGLWGGEPLVREDIGVIVDEARRLGFLTTMVTNGALVRAKADVVQALDHVIVSLDGRPENHDRVRGRGTHAKVIRALDVLDGVGRSFTTLTVLTRHNLGDIAYVLDLAEARGGSAAFQVLHHPPALAGAAPGLAPSDAALRETVERILQARRAGRPVLNSEPQLRALLDWPDFSVTRVHDAGAACLAGRLYGNVDADGRLYPCSLLVGEMAGASTAGGFEPAWEALDPSPCTRCTATAFAEYNRLFALDPCTVLDWIAAIA